MKTLKETILEKLVLSKTNTGQNFLTKEQFQIICMYILSYIKEEDLWLDYINDEYIQWGEMERYSEYGIDFSKYPFIENIVFSEDEYYVDLRNNIDNFAGYICEFHKRMIEYCKLNKKKPFEEIAIKHTKQLVFYLIEYVNKGLININKKLKWDAITKCKIYHESVDFTNSMFTTSLSICDTWLTERLEKTIKDIVM
jgi:hypothetical protein